MARSQHTARFVAGLTLAIVFVTGAAQAERPRIYAITGAHIVTAPGKSIANGTIVMRDGLIEAVGSGVTVPADAEVIAAQPGWTIYPAFIDAASAAGLGKDARQVPPASGIGRGSAEAKRKGAPHELESVRPEDDVLDRVDFSDTSIAQHRAMGFAAAQVLPDKGVFRGGSAVIMLRPGPATDLVARNRVGQVIALEASSFMQRKYPSSKFGAVATVRQVLLDARRQNEWNARYQANPAGMAPPEFRSSDAALLRVLDQGQPVIWVSLIGLDPARFGNLAREFGLHGMTVARGLGDREQDLRAADMPVLLPLEMPAKPDVKSEDALAETSLEKMQIALRAPKLPGALAANGVKLAFVTLGMKAPGSFPQSLAAIVKAGFPADAALAAVTTTPAELLGLSRSMGSLEPGKQANLLVVDGELFTDKPALRYVFIEGYPEKIEADKAKGAPPEAGGRPRGPMPPQLEGNQS